MMERFCSFHTMECTSKKKHRIGVVFDCVIFFYQGATLNEEHFQWLDLTSTLTESSQDSAKNLWLLWLM